MRKINITVEIEDNDFIEHTFRSTIYSVIGEDKIIDYRKFPNVEHLKDNKSYIELVKAKIKAGLELDRYINDNRL